MAEREMLAVTLSFDQDVVDGAPAARFGADLRRRMEDPVAVREVVGR